MKKDIQKEKAQIENEGYLVVESKKENIYYAVNGDSVIICSQGRKRISLGKFACLWELADTLIEELKGLKEVYGNEQSGTTRSAK